MRVLLTCFFGLLTLILHLLGRYAPDFVFLFYPAISQNILRIVGGFFSVFPLAMWEILALALFVWTVYTLIRDVSDLQFLRWITGFALSVSIGLFSVTLLWGLNYYSPPMHQRMDLSGKEYSVSRLKEATVYYRDKANQAAKAVSRDSDGNMEYDSFRDLARASDDGYMLLAVKYDCFRGPRFQPKRMILGEVLGLDGIFVPFTGESSVSPKTYSVCIPFAMCREMGHGNGFTSRGEAEFAAFLACTASDSPELRYSGYFNAFSFCYNALYAQDPDAARSVWQGVSQQVRQDCANRLDTEASGWRKAMAGLREDLQDAYAETFQSEEGGPDHDSVFDLLTMWYYERIL